MSFEEFKIILNHMNIVITEQEQLEAYDRFMNNMIGVRQSCKK